MPDKDKMYFNDYATLVQQQGMLQDHVRTSIYQFAVYENKEDFRGKRVLDVGAGTGILSFFAAKAGASHVYAVEASGMALKAEKLAAGNGLQDVVTVLNKRVEDVTLDEKVDLLISEPLGIALVNERMIESYIVARDMLLKPGGTMYPDHAVLHAAPFCDEALYNEQTQKSAPAPRSLTTHRTLHPHPTPSPCTLTLHPHPAPSPCTLTLHPHPTPCL